MVRSTQIVYIFLKELKENNKWLDMGWRKKSSMMPRFLSRLTREMERWSKTCRAAYMVEEVEVDQGKVKGGRKSSVWEFGVLKV